MAAPAAVVCAAAAPAAAARPGRGSWRCAAGHAAGPYAARLPVGPPGKLCRLMQVCSSRQIDVSFLCSSTQVVLHEAIAIQTCWKICITLPNITLLISELSKRSSACCRSSAGYLVCSLCNFDAKAVAVEL